MIHPKIDCRTVVSCCVGVVTEIAVCCATKSKTTICKKVSKNVKGYNNKLLRF